jgi:hypothetical protein
VLCTTGTEDPLCFWAPFTLHVSLTFILLCTTGTEDPLCFWAPFTLHVSLTFILCYGPLALLIDYYALQGLLERYGIQFVIFPID